MAVNFSLKIVKEKGHYESKFLSVTGEEYVVRLHINNTHYEGSRMSLKWKTRCTKHLSASFFTEANKLLESKYLFVEDAVHASMTIHPNSYVIKINVAPDVSLQKDKPQSKNLVTNPVKPAVESDFRKLANDMGDLLYSQTGDVVLAVNSFKFRVHKVILSARSSVFNKMFQHPMKENRENRVVIEDISVGVMWELLHFIYTGTTDVRMSSVMAHDLYSVADKYDLMELKEICATVLKKSMDLYSVFNTLLLAHLYSDESLKEAAMNFITRNYPQLKRLHTWKNFITEHQSLAVEVMDYVLEKKI